MSLDISLIAKERIKKKSSGLFIRSNGQTKEISIDEWHALNPDKEPIILEQQEIMTKEVYSDNITHNLTTMADEAGLYKYLWKPADINITKASDLIEPLRQGLHNLKMNPAKYEKLNPENGWGSYNVLVKFVENYLDACYKYPDTTIEVDR